ncbi:hypothetical protein AJ85_19160 [Alkalihalobacillus alcalophilus ATCC 27647 = CGMCC 1.3604]|uniref:Sporulation protein n=2 Tax=Alkalihalobacillus alcalophilus ATCC 27647 = CGMCC 1.3604 TaxID=1218173 RepID=A0A4S4JVH1_ALKAL|nr:hypothetical protein AJ85_19160 [Alkalihalobacillus alcalophilus ATCC 27647 = CGMCC 1.3604]
MDKMKKIIMPLFVLIILMSGCQNTSTNEPMPQSLMVNNVTFDQMKANESKKELMKMNEIIDVHAVSFEDKIYVAPKVKQFSRFRLKEIRKEGFDKIKAQYSEDEIHVSTDKKVYMELEKLEKEMKDKSLKEKDLKERLKKIEEYMKG